MMSKMFGTTMALLLLAGGAEAVELLTPPLVVSDFVTCLISNVSSTERTVRIEVLSGPGNTIQDSGELSLAAGATTFITFDPVSSSDLRCRFTGEGNKGNFLATAAVRSVDGGDDHVSAQ